MLRCRGGPAPRPPPEQSRGAAGGLLQRLGRWFYEAEVAAEWGERLRRYQLRRRNACVGRGGVGWVPPLWGGAEGLGQARPSCGEQGEGREPAPHMWGAGGGHFAVHEEGLVQDPSFGLQEGGLLQSPLTPPPGTAVPSGTHMGTTWQLLSSPCPVAGESGEPLPYFGGVPLPP